MPATKLQLTLVVWKLLLLASTARLPLATTAINLRQAGSEVLGAIIGHLLLIRLPVDSRKRLELGMMKMGQSMIRSVWCIVLAWLWNWVRWVSA
jgi:hypothetical protein